MSVWSDPRVIELSKKFVPATDEVWRLQRGSDPECLSFQKMADQGHYGGRPGTTRQGIYVCAPTGKFLTSVNSTRADRVLQMMKEGLKEWEDLADSERQLASDSEIKPEHRWEVSYPTDGLVLNMFTRDLPEGEDPEADCSTKWNQDRVWFSAAEARKWLPDDLELGSEHRLPVPLLNRLVQFHLVDTVNGQTSPFSPFDISKDTHIRLKVVGRSGPELKLEISGETHAESIRRSRTAVPHGVSTDLMGQATFDLEQARFTEFEIVALGERWGYTRNNGRRRDAEAGPVGFVFRLASPDEPRIAPAFVSYYSAGWISRP